MKRVGELMAEIGFNKNAPDSAKEAFIKYLIRQSEGVNVVTPSERKEIEANPNRVKILPQGPAQMAFDFDATGTDNVAPSGRGDKR